MLEYLLNLLRQCPRLIGAQYIDCLSNLFCLASTGFNFSWKCSTRLHVHGWYTIVLMCFTNKNLLNYFSWLEMNSLCSPTISMSTLVKWSLGIANVSGSDFLCLPCSSSIPSTILSPFICFCIFVWLNNYTVNC